MSGNCLIAAVFFILAAANTIADHAANNATYHGTGCPVFLIDHRTGYRTAGTTNNGTFSGLAPAFFFPGGCFFTGTRTCRYITTVTY